MGYTKQTVKGIGWLGALRVITRLISFGKIAILARILTPAQFGLFGIAALVFAFIDIITETGINVFLVAHDEEISTYINTAWIVSIFRGVIITLVIVFSAPFVASFFNAPEAYQLLLLISFVPFIKGFINPAIVTFQKELQFHKEFYFRSVIFFIDALSAVVLTFYTHSAAGMVGGLIIGGFAEVILSFLVVRPLPSFAFRLPLIKTVIGKGKWLTIAGVFNYFFQHGDDVVVGKLLGISSLGLYDVAYRVSLLPISEVGDVVGKVTFPIYVKIADDAARLKYAFLRTVSAITLLVVPIGFLLFFFPREIIGLLLGPQWFEAAAILQVLAIFGVIRAILNASSPLFLSVKKQEYITTITLVSLIVMAVSIVPLIHGYGLLGAGYAVIAATVSTIPLICYYLFKVFKA